MVSIDYVRGRNAQSPLFVRLLTRLRYSKSCRWIWGIFMKILGGIILETRNNYWLHFRTDPNMDLGSFFTFSILTDGCILDITKTGLLKKMNVFFCFGIFRRRAKKESIRLWADLLSDLGCTSAVKIIYFMQINATATANIFAGDSYINQIIKYHT